MQVSADGMTNTWRIQELERRLNEVKPEALAHEVGLMRVEMNAVKRLLWTLIVTVIGSGIGLVVTILSKLGTG